MVDRERVLRKLDALSGYVGELRQVAPANFLDYQASIEKRRACERLLQLSIESAIDVCALLTAGNRLGLPGEEDDVFEKLERAGLLNGETVARLRKMKGMRNVLVHEYARIDDRLIFEALERVGDFEQFADEVLTVIR